MTYEKGHQNLVSSGVMCQNLLINMTFDTDISPQDQDWISVSTRMSLGNHYKKKSGA